MNPIEEIELIIKQFHAGEVSMIDACFKIGQKCLLAVSGPIVCNNKKF